MDAVHDRRLLLFQRPRRGYVGGDHVIFDKAVRIEPLPRCDGKDPALLIQNHAALRQIELERFALFAGR